MKEIALEAVLNNLDTAMQFVDAQLEEAECSPKTQMQIDLSVEEIFVNIANYAFRPNTGSVTIRVSFQPDNALITVTFIDNGVPYNPLAKEDPDLTLPAEERSIGGLGILLVKKNMDSLRYEYKNGQNILTMEKRL